MANGQRGVSTKFDWSEQEMTQIRIETKSPNSPSSNLRGHASACPRWVNFAAFGRRMISITIVVTISLQKVLTSKLILVIGIVSNAFSCMSPTPVVMIASFLAGCAARTVGRTAQMKQKKNAHTRTGCAFLLSLPGPVGAVHTRRWACPAWRNGLCG